MVDKIGEPSGHIGTGSTLLLKDLVPLANGATRASDPINTSMCGKIGIDIKADKACTVKIVRLPDGVTAGEVSDVGSVVAGTPAFFLLQPALPGHQGGS